VGAVAAQRMGAGAALVLVGLVPVTSGLARGIPLPGLRLSEVLTVGIAVCLLLFADAKRDARWRLLDTAAIVFVLAHFSLSLIAAYADSRALSGEDLNILVGPLQFYLYYRALALTLTTPRLRGLALVVLLGASIPVSISVLAQQVLPGVDAALHSLTGYVRDADTSTTLSRATGPFAHFQVLSAYLTAMILIAVSTLLYGREIPRSRPIAIAALGLAIVALVQTVTLTSMIGALVGSLALVASHPQRWRMLAAVAATVTLLAVAFAPLLATRIDEQTATVTSNRASARNPLVPQSVAFRYDIWTKDSLPAIREHLLLGTGPTIPDSVGWRSTESMYITLLFRGGVVLLAVWLALMAAFIHAGRRRFDSPDVAQRVAGRALVTLVAVLLVMQLIQPYLTYGGVSHVVWLLAAMVVVNPDLYRAFRAPSRHPAWLGGGTRREVPA
jgi:hypothetical protein